MSYVEIPSSWCKRVKAARLEKNWAAKRLAREAGVSLKLIRRIEFSSAGLRCQDVKWTGVLRACGLEQAWRESDVGDTQTTAELQGNNSALPKVDVFVASGMESLQDEYGKMRDVAMEVVTLLRDEFGLTVFYAGECRPSKADFEDESWALRENLGELDRTKRLILIYPPPVKHYSKPLASSILVELGYSIARGIPFFLFFMQSRDTLPFLLRSADNVFTNSLVLRYRHVDDILAGLRAHAPWLLDTK